MQLPSCDIILLSWNNPHLLKNCVESVLKNTDSPARLIIVDNGSDAQTVRYLQSLKGTASLPVEILYNPTNEGFAKGNNRGIRHSTAPYVCLLNNDTVVAPGWLGILIEAAQTNPIIGIVNPTSNSFGGGPSESNLASVEAYARSRMEPARLIEMGSAIGFCFLIKRAVIDSVGLLDEQYEKAYYEDIDYCLQAKKAGFICVMATGAYVYHVEKASSGGKTKNADFIQKNRRRFLKKWGQPQRALSPLYLEKSWVESSRLRETLLAWVQWTRAGHHFVDLLCYNPHNYTTSELFQKASLMEHADIHLLPYNGPRGFFPWKALKRALLKRKKPYTLYGSPQQESLRLLNQTQWLHQMNPLILF